MRLQKLYLPDRQVNEDLSEERFALVLDDCGESLTDEELTKARQFASECGADGLWVTGRKVVVDPSDEATPGDKPVKVDIDYTDIDGGKFFQWLDEQARIYGRPRYRGGL